MSRTGLTFPKGFGWGVATASYQIEGAVNEGGRGPSIWDTFAHTNGTIEDGTTGDVADDHYHRWDEDLELISDLGVGHYRFSIAWPRILPDGTGPANQQGLDFYDRLVDGLLEFGISPWVTLYHWDLPQRLEDAGGWTNRDTAYRLAEFGATALEALGDRVHTWTTLNEPYCSAFLGYARGNHAPGHRDPQSGIEAAHHLLLGHGLTVAQWRGRAEPKHEFGITLNLTPILSATDSPADVDAARRIDGIANRWFLDPVVHGCYPADVLTDLQPGIDFDHVRDGDLATISQPVDALGVNYYMRHQVRAGHADRFRGGTSYIGSGDVEFVSRDLPHTDMGWEVDPDGLEMLLLRLSADPATPPLWITENGAAYRDVPVGDDSVADPERVTYLRAHLHAAHRAIAQGVDVRGYFAWTLMDNFEWSFGLAKRFGLYAVDYDTQRRHPKDSARWFARVAAANAIEIDSDS